MKDKDFLLVLVFGVFIIVVIWVATTNCKNIENYRDPIWMSPNKLYQDYYPRANGSIYGTPQGGWNMFSGLNFYPRAY